MFLVSSAWNSFGFVSARRTAPEVPLHPHLSSLGHERRCPRSWSVCRFWGVSLLNSEINHPSIFSSVLLRRLIDFPGACLLSCQRRATVCEPIYAATRISSAHRQTHKEINLRIKAELEHSVFRWRLFSKYRFFSLSLPLFYPFSAGSASVMVLRQP